MSTCMKREGLTRPAVDLAPSLFEEIGVVLPDLIAPSSSSHTFFGHAGFNAGLLNAGFFLLFLYNVQFELGLTVNPTVFLRSKKRVLIN